MDNQYKECSHCKKYKQLDKFHINRSLSFGRHYCCRLCSNVQRKIARSKRKEHYKEYAISRYKKYKKDWLIFFINYYGNEPMCSVCDKQLKWRCDDSKFQANVVCWDHCSESSRLLKVPPAVWCGSHVCSKSNQEKWLNFNLGVLCGRCNICLPTKYRLKWLQRAISYTESMIGIGV